MDTTGFFNYPTLPAGSTQEPAPAASADPGFLPYATVAEWDAVLAATETLRFHPGDVVLRAGERDRAFYLLLDGRLEAEGGDEVVAPADDRRRGVPRRRAARGHAPRAHARRAGAHELGRLRGPRGPRPAARAARSCATSAAASPPGSAPPARRCPSGRAEAMTAFPNYTQIPARLPVGAWQVIRVVTLLGAIGLAMALVVVPDDGLFVLWKLVIPVLPLLWLVVPGLWRNVCPLSASNQTPRVLGLSKALTAPDWLKEYGFVIAAGMFILFVSLRKVGLDDSGPASALLLLGALTGGFIGGMLLKGKSGWCSSICPLLPIQRLYGQTPYKLVANSHCTPCVGLHQVLLRLQPEGRVPRRPQRPGSLLGRLPQAVRRRLPRARARLLQPARGARRARRSSSSTASSASTWPRASPCSTRSTRC